MTGGRVRSRLVSGWHFTRHLLEMVVAMVAGMAVLGLALGALGEPPGYANPLVEYGLMGASMSVPVVVWMRYRGHSWSDGGEMTAAMLVPMFALLLPVELGVVGLTGHTLAMLSHAAMIVGMASEGAGPTTAGRADLAADTAYWRSLQVPSGDGSPPRLPTLRRMPPYRVGRHVLCRRIATDRTWRMRTGARSFSI